MNKKLISAAAILLSAGIMIGSGDCVTVGANSYVTVSAAKAGQKNKKKISPSGYDLDKAVDITDMDYLSEINDNKVYLLYSDYKTNIYGTGAYDKSVLIIEHDGVIDEFKRRWYGERDEIMSIYMLYNYDDGSVTVCTSVQIEEGTGCDLHDMVYFYINNNGHYKMRSIEQKTVTDYLNKHVKMKASKKNHTIRLSSDVSGSSLLYKYDPQMLDGIKSITYTDYPICWYSEEKYSSQPVLEYNSFFEIDDMEMCRSAIPTIYDIYTSIEIIFDGKGGYSFGNINFKAIS